MKNILTAIFVALISLFMTGYSVHMIVGGSVSPNTEKIIIGAALLAVSAVLAYMAFDLRKTKKGD